jgi:hypothetical protein
MASADFASRTSIEQALNKYLGFKSDPTQKPLIQYTLDEKNVFSPSVVGQNLIADSEFLFALLQEVSLKKLFQTGILNILKKHKVDSSGQPCLQSESIRLKKFLNSDPNSGEADQAT